jgi:WbqC-like protein family
LTIPVEVKGKYFQKINETVINDPDWSRLHWKTITHSYSKAAFFQEYRDRFEELYLGSAERYLSQVNHRFIVAICAMLGITTKISWSMNYNLAAGKTERIIDLCAQAGATEYISGPAAKAYMHEDLFRANGIALSYIDYSGYPEYRQLYPPFEHQVSIIDLILNEGPNAPKYMKSF